VTKLALMNNSLDLSQDSQNKDVVKLLQAILEQNKAMNDRKEKDREAEGLDEWEEAAKIVDIYQYITIYSLLYILRNMKTGHIY
jgi:hypothetical protein